MFIMCIEWLVVGIHALVNDGVWELIYFLGRGLPLSHLLFVDNVMIFCKANGDQAKVVVVILDKFNEVSRLKVNLDKSNFICSKGVLHVVKG